MKFRSGRSEAATLFALVLACAAAAPAAGQDARDRSVEGDSYLPRRPLVARLDSALRAYARAKVDRLEARENTHQYAYYCVHD